MPLKFGNTNIENVVFNGVTLDKIIYNGVTVFEALVQESWQTNTYINTGAGHTGGETKEWTYTFDVEVRPVELSIYSNNNRGTTSTWKFYGSTNGSNWVLLAEITAGGGTHVKPITTNAMYRYFKISQQGANWRRDDGNMVFSIEPWKITYKRRK